MILSCADLFSDSVIIIINNKSETILHTLEMAINASRIPIASAHFAALWGHQQSSQNIGSDTIYKIYDRDPIYCNQINDKSMSFLHLYPLFLLPYLSVANRRICHGASWFSEGLMTRQGLICWYKSRLSFRRGNVYDILSTMEFFFKNFVAL